jgi:hypothetical protein
MALPSSPLWYRNVLGEDALYFSQPAGLWGGACVARCTIVMLMSEHNGIHTLYPMQCGQIAGIDAHGRSLCAWHWHCCWECQHCGVVLPSGEGGYCSDACRDTAEAEGHTEHEET